MANGLPVKIKIMKEYKYLKKILSYLFYGFLIGAFLVPDEYRLLDIKLVVSFSEYVIGMIIIFIFKEISNIDKN